MTDSLTSLDNTPRLSFFQRMCKQAHTQNILYSFRQGCKTKISVLQNGTLYEKITKSHHESHKVILLKSIHTNHEYALFQTYYLQPDGIARN